MLRFFYFLVDKRHRLGMISKKGLRGPFFVEDVLSVRLRSGLSNRVAGEN